MHRSLRSASLKVPRSAMFALLCLLATLVLVSADEKVVTVTKGYVNKELQRRLIIHIPDGRCHVEASVVDFNCMKEDRWAETAQALSVTLYDRLYPARLDVRNDRKLVTVLRRRDANHTCAGTARAVIATGCNPH